MTPRGIRRHRVHHRCGAVRVRAVRARSRLLDTVIDPICVSIRHAHVNFVSLTRLCQHHHCERYRESTSVGDFASAPPP